MTIDGPSKVQMSCQECTEGYLVSYTPMAPGNYLISVKYAGAQHIVGSPFKAKVSGGLGPQRQLSLSLVIITLFPSRCFHP